MVATAHRKEQKTNSWIGLEVFMMVRFNDMVFLLMVPYQQAEVAIML
jgi:hypothetical protein